MKEYTGLAQRTKEVCVISYGYFANYKEHMKILVGIRFTYILIAIGVCLQSVEARCEVTGVEDFTRKEEAEAAEWIQWVYTSTKNPK